MSLGITIQQIVTTNTDKIHIKYKIFKLYPTFNDPVYDYKTRSLY